MKDSKGHGSNKKGASSALPNPFSEVKGGKARKPGKPMSRDKALPNPFGGSSKKRK